MQAKASKQQKKVFGIPFNLSLSQDNLRIKILRFLDTLITGCCKPIHIAPSALHNSISGKSSKNNTFISKIIIHLRQDTEKEKLKA